MKRSIDGYRSVDKDLLIDVITCSYLIDNEAMTKDEGVCLIQSITETKCSEVPTSDYPETISERAFRLGFLYQKLFVTLQSCMAAVGLKDFQVRNLK